MAKRKKSKETKKSFSYSIELTGLILILIGIIGMGFGPIGRFIKGFSLFLAGEFWYIILFSILILGVYMLFNRKLPKFFSTKLIGIYLIFIIVLTLAHFNFLDGNPSFEDIINTTASNFESRFASIASNGSLLASGDNSIVVGGGMIGALFVGLLATAFGKNGAIIVCAILGVFALILIFNITISDFIKGLFEKVKKDNENDEDDEDDEKEVKKHKEFEIDGDELVTAKNKDDEEIKEERKIVINSIDDLKAVNTSEPEVVITKAVDAQEVSSGESIVSGDIDDSSYRLPKLDLLTPSKPKKNTEEAYIRSNQEILERVLNDFEIKGKVVEVHIGPAVTQYEVTVPSGTKVSRIVNINKEIALAMAAKQVRIEAPIPGKSTIGVEIPNREVASVNIREVLEATKNQNGENKILVALGKDIMGTSILTDLTKTPHLLVAGSTGSGKSVCINTIISSILIRYKPDEVKLIMVDPKKVELSNYNGIPHLLCPVVCDPKKASATLQRVVKEMENRYELFSEMEVKNIAGYNEYITKENKKHPESTKAKMSYIVVIIDELADLMMVASKEVEDSIMRITQMARAAGIHLIVATQRPSTDIITGVIKNNIPSRISFSVSSAIDSRTILDCTGAEKLLGRGDMLYKPMDTDTPTRIQGCFVSDEEIHKLIEFVKTQAQVKYNDDFVSVENHTSASGSGNSEAGDDDPMYDEVVQFAVETGKISASLIQRRFRFGYNRAARIIDLLESRGIIGPQNGSKPREVLVKLKGEDND